MTLRILDWDLCILKLKAIKGAYLETLRILDWDLCILKLKAIKEAYLETLRILDWDLCILKLKVIKDAYLEIYGHLTAQRNGTHKLCQMHPSPKW
jgi:hypothetical protein